MLLIEPHYNRKWLERNGDVGHRLGGVHITPTIINTFTHFYTYILYPAYATSFEAASSASVRHMKFMSCYVRIKYTDTCYVYWLRVVSSHCTVSVLPLCRHTHTHDDMLLRGCELSIRVTNELHGVVCKNKTETQVVRLVAACGELAPFLWCACGGCPF